jgi:hypothetical protein
MYSSQSEIHSENERELVLKLNNLRTELYTAGQTIQDLQARKISN